MLKQWTEDRKKLINNESSKNKTNEHEKQEVVKEDTKCSKEPSDIKYCGESISKFKVMY